MNDTEFGQKVRKMREEQGLTREQFCGDELDLSVRQLTRIEAGASKPTLSKIQYIATRLGTSLYGLMPDYVDLPEAYTKLKYEVLRTATYGEPSKVKRRDRILTEIYDDYYEDLPEEERLAIDAFQSTIDTRETATPSFGKEIIDDYFHQILLKSAYSENDLLIMHLFIAYVNYSGVKVGTPEFESFEVLVAKLLDWEELVKPKDLFILRDLLIYAIGAFGPRKRFELFPAIFTALDNIMDQTQDFQKKPVLSMLKWKYELLAQNDTETAASYYEEAVAFAQLIANSYLVERLIAEWKQDLETI